MDCEDEEKPDVVLIISKTKFPCNRKALAKHSSYFQAMFSHNYAEYNQDEIEIKLGVDLTAMETLLLTVNQGLKILEDLNFDRTLSVLRASSILQFQFVQKFCVENVLENWLNPANCLSIMINCFDIDVGLYRKSRALALWRFSKIKKTSTFLKLTIEELEDYLQDNSLNAVNGEVEVFEACSSWLQDAEASDRSQYILRVLKCIRFSEMPPSDIRTILLCAGLTENHNAALILKTIIDIKEKKIPAKESAETRSENRNVDTSSSESEGVTAERDIPVSSDISSSVISIGDESRLLLSTPPRVLPLIPCVVGHCNDPPQPYLIAFKNNKLVPLLRLTKAEQKGTKYKPQLVEANGYRVINKGENIYIVGGEFLWGYDNWNKTVWRYNKWSEKWMFETSLHIQCRHQSVCCLGNDIYVMGGFGVYRILSNTVNKYNTKTNTWTTCAPLPTAIYSAASCVYRDNIYVFGQQVWSYNPKRNHWLTLTSHANSSYNCAMPHEDAIFLTGMYSNELMSFNGAQPDAPLHSVGRFKSNATNTCLMQDTIYLFAIDVDKRLIVESYNIRTNTFQVLWSGLSKDQDTPIDLSVSSSIGCFPFINYD